MNHITKSTRVSAHQRYFHNEEDMQEKSSEERISRTVNQVIDARLSPLEEDYERRQACQQQEIARQAYFQEHHSVDLFYKKILSNLNAIFIGMFSVAGKIGARNRSQAGDRVAAFFKKLAVVIPGFQPASFFGGLGGALQVYQDQKQRNRMEKAAEILLEPEIAGRVARTITILLCERYEYQLNLLSEEGADVLARFVCAQFLRLVIEGRLKEDSTLPDQFIAALEGKERTVRDRVVGYVVRKADKSKIMHDCLKFFHVDSDVLSTTQSTGNKQLLASELFTHCGIRTQYGDYYYPEGSQDFSHGCRAGTEQEARDLGMQLLKDPPKQLQWEPKFPRSVNFEEHVFDDHRSLNAQRGFQGRGDDLRRTDALGKRALQRAQSVVADVVKMSRNLQRVETDLQLVQESQVITTRYTFDFSTLQEELQRYYRQKERGVIHLAFSNRKLDLKNAFIELAFVEENFQQKKEQRLSHSNSLPSDEETEKISVKKRGEIPEAYEAITCLKKPVELDALFDFNSEDEVPYRKLLLLGRAGIGKSTFCQKIAYEWATTSLWNDRFRYLFLVPLKNLTKAYYRDHPEEQYLENILVNECFLPRNRLEHLNLIRQMRRILHEDSNRILLILDGYDEATHIPDFMHRQLFDQIDLPNHMIVTSRHHGIESIKPKMDATLENMGFTSDAHIEKYVFHYFEDAIKQGEFPANEGEKFISFVRNRELMTMVYIPFLLEMLCSLWEKKGEEIADLTITELYRQLVEGGFQRHFSRQKMAAHLRENSQLRKAAERNEGKDTLLRILGNAAFEGIKEGQLLIEGSVIKKIASEFQVSPEEIYTSGFLKEMDGDQDWKSGYFMHLSIQEFLSSYYLATQGPDTYKEALKSYQYHPHMLAVWVMCVALLESMDPKNAEDFFASLHKEEPSDLTERFHHRLEVVCLNAIKSEEMWEKIEKNYQVLSNLGKWIEKYFDDQKIDLSVEFQCDAVMKHPIIQEVLRKELEKGAFPVLGKVGFSAIPVLIQALREAKDEGTIKAIANQFGIIGPAAKEAAPYLTKILSNPDCHCKITIIEVLGKIGPAANEVMPTFCHIMVNEEDDTIRTQVAWALGMMGAAAKRAVPDLIHVLLEDENDTVRAQVAWALGMIGSAAGEEAVSALMAALIRKKTKKKEIGILEMFDRRAAVRPQVLLEEGVANDSSKPENRRPEPKKLSTVVTTFSDQDVRMHSAKALGKMGSMAKQAVPMLEEAAKDSDQDVRIEAKEALKKIQALERDNDEVQQEEDIEWTRARKEPYIRDDISDLSECTRERSVSDGWVPLNFSERVGQQKKENIGHLIEALQDPNRTEEWLVIIKTLGNLKAKEAVPDLIEILQKDHREYFRWAAAEALGKIGFDGTKAEEVLKNSLYDRHRFVAKTAALALAKNGSPALRDALLDKAVNRRAKEAFMTVDDHVLVQWALETRQKDILATLFKKSIQNARPLYFFHSERGQCFLMSGREKISRDLDNKQKNWIEKELKKLASEKAFHFPQFLRNLKNN